QRVLVQYDQVRHLSCLERAHILLKSDRLRPERSRAPQRLHWSHSARLQIPYFPVAAQPLHLAVAAKTHPSPGPDHICRSCGDVVVAVLLSRKPLLAALDHRIQELVRNKASQLLVAVHVSGLEVIVLGPWSAIRHQYRRRIERARLYYILDDILVK